MPKKQKCPECVGAPAWLTTFGDLMALLLTFFVLLLSFSTTKQSDFQKAIGSLQGSLGVLDGEPLLTAPIELYVPVVKGVIKQSRPTLKEAVADIEKEIESEEMQESVEIIQGVEGIVIRIRDQALFDSGKADVKEEIKPLLNRMGGVLARMRNNIEVEGHTDSRPISNEEFRNNHWLSNARALSVLDIMVEEVGIEPGRLSAVGFGEHKPLDPEANNSLPENQAKNRRVEIKVRYQEGAEEMDTAGVKKLLQEADLSAQEDLQGID